MAEIIYINKPRRLNIKLDGVSFSRLERIKETHGDKSYTRSIKRAIAVQDYFDTQIEKEGEFLFENPKTKQFYTIVFP